MGFILTTFVADADTASLAGTTNAHARAENRMAIAAELKALKEQDAANKLKRRSSRKRLRQQYRGGGGFQMSSGHEFTLSGGANGGGKGRGKVYDEFDGV